MSDCILPDHSCSRCEYVRRTERDLFAISADSDESLHFPELDLSQESFRLIRLLPSRIHDSELSCLLFSTTQHQWKGKYAAGSYVCGPTYPQKMIYVNGSRFFVGENLYAFLHACRKFAESQGRCMGMVIWIDAICINQRSLKERGHQVGIMKNIFQNASVTYSWLGESHDDTDWLFDTVSRTDSREILAKRRERVRFLSGLINVVKRPYFTRLWILQEFVLAPQVHLLCGNKNLKLSKLAHHLQDPSLTSHDEIQQSIFFAMWKMRKTQFITSTFEDIFCEFASLACSLRHDKIYALRSLIPFRDHLSKKLSIRYDFPLEEILGNILQLSQLDDPFRFTQKALSELQIDPLHNPIRPLIAVSRDDLKSWDGNTLFVRVQYTVGSMHLQHDSYASACLRYIPGRVFVHSSKFFPAKLTSSDTFAEMIVLAVMNENPGGVTPTPSEPVLVGILTPKFESLEVTHPVLLAALEQTTQALSYTTKVCWDQPPNSSRDILQATVQIRYDIFGALAYLSSLMDAQVGTNGSLDTDLEVYLETWTDEMRTLVNHTWSTSRNLPKPLCGTEFDALYDTFKFSVPPAMLGQAHQLWGPLYYSDRMYMIVRRLHELEDAHQESLIAGTLNDHSNEFRFLENGLEGIGSS